MNKNDFFLYLRFWQSVWGLIDALSKNKKQNKNKIRILTGLTGQKGMCTLHMIQICRTFTLILRLLAVPQHTHTRAHARGQPNNTVGKTRRQCGVLADQSKCAIVFCVKRTTLLIIHKGALSWGLYNIITVHERVKISQREYHNIIRKTH